MTNQEIEKRYKHLNENQKTTLRNLRNRRRNKTATKVQLKLINTLQCLGREGTSSPTKLEEVVEQEITTGETNAS